MMCALVGREREREEMAFKRENCTVTLTEHISFTQTSSELYTKLTSNN